MSWTANENIDSDVSFEKYQRLCGHVDNQEASLLEEKTFAEADLKDIPEQFDAREQWPQCESIKEVRDQSDCGSCWAFGSAEMMSDRICIGSKQTLQTRISSADILSCCRTCGYGCDGGNIEAAARFWLQHGVVTGDLYQQTGFCMPYPFPPCAHHTDSDKYPGCPAKEYDTPKCVEKCDSSYGKTYQEDKHFASKVYTVRGASRMATEIATNGPLTVGFTVYEDFLTYKSGVYVHQAGRPLGGHAVKIIGYGVEDGQEYWLVANSWNETWGDQGFFKILRGRNHCGIESGAVGGFPKL